MVFVNECRFDSIDLGPDSSCFKTVSICESANPAQASASVVAGYFFFGSQSSIRLPSGSVTQVKRP